MPNKNNLVQNSGRSREEVKEINRKGGKKSGEVRRKKRLLGQSTYFIILQLMVIVV